ncbi:hypothetical protein, unlikely [Trypanosoma congolense IL3000]|uniref:Uncharacterized protein n=1 Tax=Trypanosoma congolense (strain IL3000) TaxID=1068625 RepID=F9WEF7_TRYCI|nr:hypothetical protein, unlikely [Trypanosoma congolense IL3000]
MLIPDTFYYKNRTPLGDAGHLNVVPGYSTPSRRQPSAGITPVRQDGVGQEADGYQRGSMQQHRHSWVNEAGRILPCTCGRATLDARRFLLPVRGDVGRNPGPMIRGAQWNAGVYPRRSELPWTGSFTRVTYHSVRCRRHAWCRRKVRR